MSNYKNLVTYIIDNLGGKENIEDITHCITRLRFQLKDSKKINEDKLKENQEIITTQFAGGKFQIVIGTHVGEVYEEVLKQTNLSFQQKEDEGGSVLDKFTSIITKIVTPALGVLGGTALILGLNSFLLAIGVIQSGDGTNILLNAIGNSVLTFFPIILGYTSAKAFKMDPFIGMVLGAVMVFPNITESINAGDALTTIFANSSFAMPVYKTFLGIPILFPSTGYTTTMIPIVMATFFASKVEKFFNGKLPNAGKYIFLPFLTISISAIVSILAIGPISIILTNAISAGISSLLEFSPLLAFIVITLIYQPLVIFGLHWALITVGIMEFFSVGSSLIIASIFPASFAHLAVSLAVYFKSKNEKTKSIALPSAISATFCIIEPSIYGITLPVKKRFAFCMIGGSIGGVILGLLHTPLYAITVGATGFVGFINSTTGNASGVIVALLAVAATMTVSFLLTWFTFEENATNENENKKMLKEKFLSPMKGKTISLTKMEDKAFSEEKLGKGICVIPQEGKVVAPFDGTMTMAFPTGHAIGLVSKSGVEMLIHIGSNAETLPNDVFQLKKKQGDKIKKGDLLLTFDLKKLIDTGFNVDTAIIVTNTLDYLDVVEISGENVDFLEELLIVLSNGNVSLTTVKA